MVNTQETYPNHYLSRDVARNVLFYIEPKPRQSTEFTEHGFETLPATSLRNYLLK